MNSGELFDKALAIEERWQHRPGMRFQWRMNHEAFDAIVEMSAGPKPSEVVSLREFGPKFARLEDEQDRAWAERIRHGRESWGKEGNQLLGWPVICDDSFNGIEPEVAVL
jgi:hypothetical protein